MITKGFVIATPNKLRKKIGFLDADMNSINFENTFLGTIRTQEINIHNTTEDTLFISYSGINDLDGIQMKIDPAILFPANYGKLVISFNSKNRDFGMVDDVIPIDIESAGKKEQGRILLKANILEDFSNLTANELANSPRISIQNKILILKNLKPGELRTEKIELGNNGLRDLLIRNIQIHNNKFTVEPKEFTINPRNQGSFNISVIPDNFSAKLKTSVTIISNDPNQSVINLTIIGEVDLPKKSSSKSEIIEVDIEKANSVINSFKGNDELVIMDVRTEDEYNNDFIETTVNFDFESSSFIKMLKLLDTSKTYLVYSQSGIRSKKAVELMSSMDFRKIYHMYEGIDGWKAKRLKLTDPNK